MAPNERKVAASLFAVDIECDAVIDDEDEPTSDQLVEMLRESIQQAKEGKTRPVEELLRELDEILAEDDHAG